MSAGFRSIPTTRVKAFVERYIETNYETEPDDGSAGHDNGYQRFCFEAHIPARGLYRIRSLEVPNLSFDFVDRMLVNLDCLHIWHVSKEDGGFADYYEPDIPPAPVEETAEQARYRSDSNAKLSARKRGMHVMDVLHERALAEVVAA